MTLATEASTIQNVGKPNKRLYLADFIFKTGDHEVGFQHVLQAADIHEATGITEAFLEGFYGWPDDVVDEDREDEKPRKEGSWWLYQFGTVAVKLDGIREVSIGEILSRLSISGRIE